MKRSDARSTSELFPLEWIDRIISINSETERSNSELITFLKPLVQAAGLKYEEHKVMENGIPFFNLIASTQGATHPEALLFNTHLDTVSGGETSAWTKTGGNPLKATWVRDRVYGLGAADVKIDFLCKLWAVTQAKPSRPFVLVGTYGEERGLIGVQKLFADKKIAPRYAMVGEPSDLELIYAHKGHLIGVARLPTERSIASSIKQWKGKAAHSSTPQLGINALVKCLTEIKKRKWGIVGIHSGTNSNKVPELARAQVSPAPGKATSDILGFIEKVEDLATAVGQRRDPRFSPSMTTLSWNMAYSEQGWIELTFDFRTLPGVDSDVLRRKLEALLPKSGQWRSLTIDLALAGDKESTLMKAATEALKTCGVKPVSKTKASSTEAAIYHHHGAQAIVFGPGISVGNVHKPNEHNLLSQIRVATQFYRELLSSRL